MERSGAPTFEHTEASVSAFDAAPVALAVVGADLRVQTANRAFAEWVGRERAQCLRLSLAALLPLPAGNLVEAALRRALAGSDATASFRDAARPASLVRLRCRPWPGSGGESAVVVAVERFEVDDDVVPGLGRDIRTLIDKLPVFIAYYGTDWRFHYVNAHYELWYRRQRAWFIGRSIVEVLGRRVFAMIEPYVERAFAGEEVWFSFDHLTPNGAELRSFHGYLVPDRQTPDSVAGVFAMFEDVTEQRSAERAATQAQWEMQVVADRLPALVAYVDNDLRYRYVNRQFEQWYQKPAAWFIGRTVEEVVGDVFEITGRLLKRAAQGEALEFEYPRRNPLLNPPDRHIRVQLVPDLTAGEPCGFIALMEDVTERLEAQNALRDSEERLRQITETIDDMFWLIEIGNPRSMYVSPGFSTIYARGMDAAGGMPTAWLEWVHPEDRERMRRHFARLAHGWGYTEEYRILRPDGSERWVLEKTHRVAAARPGGILIAGLTTDITERRRIAELKRMKEEAESANQTKSEFLSKMSHELRTPLNAVLGFAQLMLFDSEHDLDPAQRESVNEIIVAGRHLLAIVDEMLDLTRIEMGKLRLAIESITLCEVVAECVSMVQGQAEARAVVIAQRDCAAGGGQLILADRTRVRQILLNLLSNAIKYNVTGGRVAIRTEAVGDHAIRISVEDTGPGLTPNQLEQLFVPFQRLDAERITAEGLGLGLALSKQLAEAMGGAIGAASVPGQGCTFWLELPLA
jgi:PAS domain S-box-containing protein